MTSSAPFWPEKDKRRYETRIPTLHWDGDTKLRIDDINFRLTYDTNELHNTRSDTDNFILGKARPMVERAVAIAAQGQTGKIFELGILHGGSVVLYDKVFSPLRLVAIDVTAKPVKALDDYIVRHDKPGVVRPYYGVSQSDRTAMEALLTAEFPARDIDLIIDDASHVYEHTREAFNISFPFLAAGGLYMIEDWAWAHWAGDYWQGKNSVAHKLTNWVRRRARLPALPQKVSWFADKVALSNLLIELFMLSASRPDLIADVLIDNCMVVVRKGTGTVPPGRFDIADYYLLRGKKFKPWL